MKKIAILLPAVAAVLLLNASSVLAAEGMMSGDQGQTTMAKDECLLVAKNCVDNVDSIQQRINKLQHEINKGSAVYTQDELRILNRKLDSATNTLNELFTQ